MTHDPMCPVTRELAEGDSCMGCSLIAKVRADERQQAEMRVAVSVPNTPTATGGEMGAKVHDDRVLRQNTQAKRA